MNFVLVRDIHTESDAYEPTMHTHRWAQKTMPVSAVKHTKTSNLGDLKVLKYYFHRYFEMNTNCGGVLDKIEKKKEVARTARKKTS